MESSREPYIIREPVVLYTVDICLHYCLLSVSFPSLECVYARVRRTHLERHNLPSLALPSKSPTHHSLLTRKISIIRAQAIAKMPPRPIHHAAQRRHAHASFR